MSPDWIGWTASAILIATLARQIEKQGDRDAGGVSLVVRFSVRSIGGI